MNFANEIDLMRSPIMPKTERITALHTFGNAGEYKLVTASNLSYFTEIYCSKRGAVSIMLTVVPFFARDDNGAKAHVKGLCLHTLDFDATTDWVIAAEHPQYGQAGRLVILFGAEKFGSIDQIVESVKASRRAAEQKRTAPTAPNSPKKRMFSGIADSLRSLCRQSPVNETTYAQFKDCAVPQIQRFSLMEGGVLPLPQIRTLVGD